MTSTRSPSNCRAELETGAGNECIERPGTDMKLKPLPVLCFAILLVGPIGCEGRWREYAGPKRSDTAIAIVDESNVLTIQKVRPREKIEGFGGKGNKIYYRPGIELLPGSYELVTKWWKGSLDERHGRN